MLIENTKSELHEILSIMIVFWNLGILFIKQLGYMINQWILCSVFPHVGWTIFSGISWLIVYKISEKEVWWKIKNYSKNSIDSKVYPKDMESFQWKKFIEEALVVFW